MENSRSKKAFRNTICQLLLEAITAACGLILPRLILSYFGSTYNGIIQSISQFISCIALLKSGIGSVTRAALYKPLAQNDSVGISEVVNATELFMQKIALIFGLFVLLFAGIYPFIIKEDFSWFFVFSLVLVLSISTVAQYFFGMTYQMLIEAAQNNYIISITQMISILLNTLISAILIVLGCSIHIVKLASAIVFIIPPVFYLLYARRKYKIDKKVSPNTNLISQRWDAFGHQLANFVNNNTDIIVTTVLLGVREVSVYAVYNMVSSNIRKIVNSVSAGTMAAFGNMIAKKEDEILKKRFEQYELLTFISCYILFTTTAILFIPFIAIYTKVISDVNYIRYGLSISFCIAEFFSCVKLVYENVVFAAGKFKETKRMAYIEAVINILVSILLARIIGLIGVLVGTICAGVFRTLMYNTYVSKNIVHRSSWKILPKICYAVICSAICYYIVVLLQLKYIDGFASWIINAIFVIVISTIIGIVDAYLIFREDTKALINMFSRIIKSKH